MEYMQEKDRNEQPPSSGWRVFEPVTPPETSATSGTLDDSAQGVKKDIEWSPPKPERNGSPAGVRSPQISVAQPARACMEDIDRSEMAVLDAWGISDKNDGSPQPSDTVDPVSHHGNKIEQSNEEDILTLDAPEDGWLQA